MTKNIKSTIKKKEESSVIEVDYKTINAAVQFINEKANETLYKGSIEIGEYLLKTFFNGDIKMAASKNPKKLASFNKLCERPDLLVKSNTLGIMVRVASQEQYFINKQIDTKELSYTHKASLVKLDNDSKKITILNKCIKNKWTTREFETEIKIELSKLTSNPKYSLIRTTKKYITKIDDVLKSVDDTTLDFDTDELSKMSDKRRHELSKYLNDLKVKVEVNRNKSKEISENCDKILEQLTMVDEEKKANFPKRGRKPTKAKEN
ncbi:MAG: hypothetical protein V2B19_02340 [Pseudomonadota bacterium]